MSASVPETIVARLQAAGVRAIFGVPGGGSNLDLIEAAGNATLPFVLTATETGGALAAVAHAEVTGALGACLTTLGPGVSSVANGVACAFLDRAPVVVFTDTHPEGARAMSHQRIDHRELMRPVTKWTTTLTAGNVAEVMDCALATAMSHPRGPIHLDCAWHGVKTSADPAFAGLSTTDRPDPNARVDPASAGLSAATFDRLVSRSRRPFLIVGLGARRREDVDAIRQFCDRRGVPAMVTYKAKGVVPDAAPTFAGVFTNGSIELGIAEHADLLIAVGLDPVELIPRPWTFPQPVVHCGPESVSSEHVPFAARCAQPIAVALAHVDELLPLTEWSRDEVTRKWRDAQAAIRTRSDRLSPDRVVEVTAARLARSHRVTVDAGAHMFPATMLWPVEQPNGMLISNGLSTMGFAVPAAIGAAMAAPDRPVVALTGDGGLLMCAGELATIARERLPVITVVFNDGSLSLIEIKQQARALHPRGVGLGAISWTALASSMGLTACSASTEAELENAIDLASASAPALIEAHVDRSGYSDVLRAIRG